MLFRPARFGNLYTALTKGNVLPFESAQLIKPKSCFDRQKDDQGDIVPRESGQSLAGLVQLQKNTRVEMAFAFRWRPRFTLRWPP